MRVPLSWLKDYVDITMSPEELAHTLTMAGLEVEAIDYIGKDWGDKIITAQIIHLEKVPGSDHLNYTRVVTGTEELGVICGAPNIQQGDKVPLALPGAKIGDITITEARKMNYISQGMLCSPRELGMGNDHSGIYILDPHTEVGQKLVDLLGEVVLEFSIKAHRGDLSSVVGIAREVAALTGQPLRMPQPVLHEQGTPTEEMVRVTIEDPDLCPRYTARIISGVKLGPSPDWMGRRLLAAGMRPINNVVDVINYVMLELGQPLHGFDYNLIPEQHIIVRRAHEKETIKTLDDVTRKLTPDMLLITDPKGPTAIAGVMGAAVSEVNDKTDTVLLEAANFQGSSVRRTSVKLGLRTDASSRYEKGLDRELVNIGSLRACQLLEELAGGSVHPGVVDCYPKPAQRRVISFSIDEVEWLTSMKVTQTEVVNALTALGFAVKPDEQGKTMLVTVPTYRNDIEEGADLVEEVIRLIGYDKIPSTIPTGPLPEPMHDDWFEREQEVRNLLIGAGLNEIVTYSLTSRARMVNLLAYANADTARYLLQAPVGANNAAHQAVESSNGTTAVATFDPRSIPAVVLANALSSDMEALRLTLMSSLMETLQENSKRNKAGLRFFEVGRRYLPTDGANSLPDERRTAGIALCGPAEISWIEELARPADFYDLKGAVETLLEGLKITNYRFTPTQHPSFHPGRCALLELPRRVGENEEVFSPAGVLGEMHPLVQQRYDLPHRAYLAEIDLERLYAAAPARTAYQPLSRHQELTRDLALVVAQDVPAQDIHDAILRNGGELLRSATLFDVYTGEPIPSGKKSLTYSLVYQSQERTLTDAEANALQEQIIQALNKDFGAVLRS
ncbi:phenylalanine--tRNA ligase beta subunit [Reticulibacter mediterranei]|uniref:Phenylalanine--tRNA ligase beta subunit n=1 Tax=Reticulibacter mediterranei TaxID=2778369 RepID=A0A8J3N0C9_9CHLR|nr:phenylalanine--tRNA ligase subunit beta [Reticulibacter mediterranei]GHO94089.1 phenylalanine--tRNA ligase beta subunit [Reticulibacter mediterranei]